MLNTYYNCTCKFRSIKETKNMYNTQASFNNRFYDLTLTNTYPNDIITIEPQKKR
jgi:hypothetical protein